MRIRKGVREIRKFPKREWDWEFKASIAAEIRRRLETEAIQRRAEEAEAAAKAAAKAAAERELSELIRSMPDLQDVDCPF